MYNKICIMVPTFKRVEWLTRLIDSVRNTASDLNNVCFCFCVNKKDPKSLDAVNGFIVDKISIIETTVQPNLSKYFNMMYDEVKRNYGPDCVVSMIGDDMVFETKNWDTRILEEINKNNGIGVFWADDGYIAHDKLCVNLFVTQKFVDATNKPFMCECFKADMIDVVWYEVGRLTGTLHYIKDVVIKHLHSTGTGEMPDYTFQRLVPLQKQANSELNHRRARVHANIIAGNLIASNFGSWC